MCMHPHLESFIKDVQMPNCIVQAGQAMRVMEIVTPENYEQFLQAHSTLDLYFLGGARNDLGLQRAKDADILMKNSLFFDCDIRKTDVDISDGQIKEAADGIEEQLRNHPVLGQWRYIVFSGNGLHLYYFGDSIQITSAENWKGGMNTFIDKLEQATEMKFDRACTNVARIARLPGSFNCKSTERKLVEIVKFQDKRASFLQKIEALTQQAPKTVSKVSPKHWGEGIGGVGEGMRNQTAVSVIGKILGEIDPALWETAGWGGLKEWNAKNNPPLSEKELRTTFESIATKELSRRNGTSKKGASEIQYSPVLVHLEDVQAEEVSWLWEQRIPRGKLTIIEGDPGVGKSWVSFALIAAITAGKALPGQDFAEMPGDALLLVAEDGLGDTVRPRLEKMGADISRVHVLEAVKSEDGKEHSLCLADHLTALESALGAGGYALILIDPLNAFLGGKIDTNRDASLRTVLTPLKRLAEKYDVAVICIRHLTKSARDKAIYRGQGSIAYTAAARVVLLVGVHPTDEALRVIVCSKNNLTAFPSALAYAVVDGQFNWKGDVNVSADQLLEPSANEEEKSALEEAEEYLKEELRDGPKRARELYADAKDAGISERTLKRAKANLNIERTKDGFGKDGFWSWQLPSSPKSASKTVAPLVDKALPPQQLPLNHAGQ
ncbi:hypothetical protein COU80_06065 [Candidatus Peregrinibacteria bacterium CG10_big_fil_rev_8_21_14_0_10_55_24]|nr:MAG: hypothetical protein COU80_06065 [Candidatus Peregrinibacteria bacterium CG10_big_fil_rev_8_21_14_0_10_55_24]